jgi:hypothetical protein
MQRTAAMAHRAAELARGDERLAAAQRVREVRWRVAAAHHRLLQLVQPARLQRDADGLLELPVREAAAARRDASGRRQRTSVPRDAPVEHALH